MAQQKSYFYLNGSLQNDSNTVLADANILELKNSFGMVSDQKGNFILRLPLAEFKLRISHIGYTTFQKSYSLDFIQSHLHNDSLILPVIRLQPKSEILQEAKVIGKQEKVFFKQPLSYVLDFNFTGNRIVILRLRNGQYELLLKNEEGKLLQHLALNFKADALYKDCIDHLHVTSKDSIYQISFEPNLHILPGLGIQKLYNTLQPCVTSLPQNLVFKQYSNHNKVLTYFRVNTEDGAVQNIKTLGKFAEIRGLNEFYHYNLMVLQAMGPAIGNLSQRQYNKQKTAFDNLWFYKRVLSKPIYDPLFKMPNGMILFDHEDDTAFCYSLNGQYQNQHFISYQKNADFDNKILQDDMTGKLYLVYNHNGAVTLRVLDLGNFSPVGFFPLKDHVFPEKLKVNNGFAWYIFHDPRGYSGSGIYKESLRE